MSTATEYLRQIALSSDQNGGNQEAGSATVAKQDEIIAKNEEIRVDVAALKTAIAPANNSTPNLAIVTSSGSVAAGAKYIKFTFLPGTTATVLGQSIPAELGTVEFPFNPGKYDAIAYTVASAGTIVITTVT